MSKVFGKCGRLIVSDSLDSEGDLEIGMPAYSGNQEDGLSKEDAEALISHLQEAFDLSESNKQAFFGQHISKEAPKTLGEVVKNYRKAKHMTLDDLAGECGFGKSTLSEIETGHTKNPGRSILFQLHIALGVPAEMLLAAQ